MTGTVLIAGVGPGLGRALASRFHGAGLAVALVARSGDTLQTLAADLGDGAVPVQADVTDRQAVTECVHTVRESLGSIDALIYNVNAPGGQPLVDGTIDSLTEIWRRRTLGCFNCLDALGEELEAVLISGTNYASEGSTQQIEWGSAAAATKGLARSVAPDLDARVVYVEIATAIAPEDTGLVDATTAPDVADTYYDLLDGEPGFHSVRIE